MPRGRREPRGRPSTAGDCLEYALLRTLRGLLGLLPLRLALACGRRLGDFAFDVLRVRREVTLANLRGAFGHELDEPGLRRLARAAFRTMGMTFTELALSGRCPPADLLRRTRIVSPDALRAARAYGRGIVFLTGHVGNWEHIGAVMAQLDEPPATIIQDQRNPLVDRFVKRLREDVGMRMIPLGSALRGVLRTLRAGGGVAIAGDQDAGPDGCFLPFLGRLASVARGPARFAYRSGAPLLIGFDRHLGDGEHELVLTPPILPDRERPESEEIERLLREYVRREEEFVRGHPEQLFWMHRRWKSRPPGERGAGSVWPPGRRSRESGA